MNQAKKQRRYHRRNALISAGLPAALLSIGIMGGVLPPHIAELLKISGTLGLITEGLRALLGAATQQQSSSSNSLCFLLEIEQASGLSN
jgi:hypothetical protein